MDQHKSPSPSFINIAVLLLFAVVIAVASSVTTYFILSSRSNEQYSASQPTVVPQTQTNVLPTSPSVGTTQTVPDDTANWKVYRNDVFRFSFKYPPSLFVVKDNLQRDKTQGSVAGQSLLLADSTNNMSLVLYINPLGFGTGPSNMTYKILYSRNKGFSVISKEEHYYSDTDEMKPRPETTTIHANSVQIYENDIQLFMNFSFNKDVSNGESTFKQILSTFKFLE